MKEEYVNRVVEGKSVIYDQIMLNVVSVYAPHVAFQFEMQMEGKIMEIHVVNIHFKRQEEHCVMCEWSGRRCTHVDCTVCYAQGAV